MHAQVGSSGPAQMGADQGWDSGGRRVEGMREVGGWPRPQLAWGVIRGRDGQGEGPRTVGGADRAS